MYELLVVYDRECMVKLIAYIHRRSEFRWLQFIIVEKRRIPLRYFDQVGVIFRLNDRFAFELFNAW